MCISPLVSRKGRAATLNRFENQGFAMEGIVRRDLMFDVKFAKKITFYYVVNIFSKTDSRIQSSNVVDSSAIRRIVSVLFLA